MGSKPTQSGLLYLILCRGCGLQTHSVRVTLSHSVPVGVWAPNPLSQGYFISFCAGGVGSKPTQSGLLYLILCRGCGLQTHSVRVTLSHSVPGVWAPNPLSQGYFISLCAGGVSSKPTQSGLLYLIVCRGCELQTHSVRVTLSHSVPCCYALLTILDTILDRSGCWSDLFIDHLGSVSLSG